MAEYYSFVYMYHNFFIHSSIDGHLGCVRVLVTVSSAIMNAGVHVSFSTIVFSGYMPVVGWLDRTVVLSQLFKESSHCPPWWCISLHFHPQCQRTPFPPPIYLSIIPSIHPPVHTSIPTCLPVCSSIHPPTVHLFIRPSLHTPIHLFSQPATCLPTFTSMHPAIYPSINSSIICSSTHPSIHSSIRSSTHLSTYLSTHPSMRCSLSGLYMPEPEAGCWRHSREQSRHIPVPMKLTALQGEAASPQVNRFIYK